MALKPPSILDETLTYQRDGSTAQITVGTASWYAWLETASAFTFRTVQGHFTARKEQAGNRRGERYWRAYLKQGGKLHRSYLGKSEELTLERLRAIAAALADQEAGGALPNGQEHTARKAISPRASVQEDHRPGLHTPGASGV